MNISSTLNTPGMSLLWAIHFSQKYQSRLRFLLSSPRPSAVSETLETADAMGDKNAAVLLQNKATDTWNFYQAKSIKKNLYNVAAANPGPTTGDFKQQAERYGADEQELFAKGQALERQAEEKLSDSERHENRDHILTVAVTLLHVAIAIATIAIIVRGQRWPWYAAIALGVLG